jgi:hypothetical protein
VSERSNSGEDVNIENIQSVPEGDESMCEGKHLLPEILSFSKSINPDCSGFCCPICGNGWYDGYGHCDLCDNSQYERREVFEYARHVDCGPHVCEECVFEVRKSDGKVHSICWVCLKKTHDVSNLRECPKCFYFDTFEGERCKWCEKLGVFWSIFRAEHGRRELTSAEKKFLKNHEKEMKESGKTYISLRKALIEKSLLSGLMDKFIIFEHREGRKKKLGFRNWMMRRRNFMQDSDRKLREAKIYCYYDDAVKLLEQEDIVDAVARSMIWEDEEADWTLYGAVHDIGIRYYNVHQAVNGMQHLARERAGRLVDHPRWGEYFRILLDGDKEVEQTYLWNLETISDWVLHYKTRHIKTKEQYEEFLVDEDVLTPEFRVLMLMRIFLYKPESESRILLDGFHEWRRKLLERTYPVAIARLFALWCSNKSDFDRMHYFESINSHLIINRNLLDSILPIICGERLHIDSTVEPTPELRALADRGPPGIRELARFLLEGSITSPLSVAERLKRLHEKHYRWFPEELRYCKELHEYDGSNHRKSSSKR